MIIFFTKQKNWRQWAVALNLRFIKPGWIIFFAHAPTCIFIPITKAVISFFKRAARTSLSPHLFPFVLGRKRQNPWKAREACIRRCLPKEIGPDPAVSVLFWWWRNLGSAGRGAPRCSQTGPVILKTPWPQFFGGFERFSLGNSPPAMRRPADKSQPRWKGSRRPARCARFCAWRLAAAGGCVQGMLKNGWKNAISRKI